MPIAPPETAEEETPAPLYIPVPKSKLPMFNCWLPVAEGASTLVPMIILFDPEVILKPEAAPRRTLLLPEVVLKPE
jgi:hypothetical protein